MGRLTANMQCEADSLNTQLFATWRSTVAALGQSCEQKCPKLSLTFHLHVRQPRNEASTCLWQPYSHTAYMPNLAYVN